MIFVELYWFVEYRKLCFGRQKLPLRGQNRPFWVLKLIIIGCWCSVGGLRDPAADPAERHKDQVVFMITYTAKYLKIESGYMGQLVEWPEVLTEGADLDECRAMLRDALQEMFTAYVQLGKEIPLGNALIEQLPIEMKHVGQTA